MVVVPIECVLPSGTKVRLDELPLRKLAPVSALLPDGVTWWVVMASPLRYPDAAAELVSICAAHVGDPPPPDEYLTVGSCTSIFQIVPVDLPAEFEDGMPVVDPKADEGEPKTAGSSGAPDDSAGLPT